MMIKQKVSNGTEVWESTQHQFRAMNTDVQFSASAQKPRTVIRLVEESFHYFEHLLSRFRPDSELCRLNESQGLPFRATHDFFAAVEAALWASQQTSGIYDPTVLGYLEAAGYDCTFTTVANWRPLFKETNPVQSSPSSNSLSAGLLTGLDYRHIELDSFTKTISLPPGLRIDLGGMGKGWTVDRVVDLLFDKGHFLLNAGGDLYAYGSFNLEGGWDVHLAHPLILNQDYASLKITHHAVTTSTIARRRWTKDGIIQHHLIDPRTGFPAKTDVISASVVGGRAFTAEIYAKTALILGVKDGLSFLESLPEVEGILYSDSNVIHMTRQMDRFLTRLDPSGY